VAADIGADLGHSPPIRSLIHSKMVRQNLAALGQEPAVAALDLAAPNVSYLHFQSLLWQEPAQEMVAGAVLAAMAAKELLPKEMCPEMGAVRELAH
jgi:hypothetical protein